ncbi:MAG: hypothetical protein O2821_00430 [Chloroflexi bacterium]|nr:hypothetical protein [Chloroflexota bacterium]MDA1226773.1 hypothetical protein [Chloroflexota bacterium]
MIGFMDYTRWIAAGIALVVFVVSQTAVPNDNVKASFVDQPLPAFSDTYLDQALNSTDASSLAPRVSIESTSVAAGKTVSVPITLSHAPNGLAGYELRVDLGAATTARIVSVEFPEFGMVYEQPGYGDNVRLAAADLYHTAETDDVNVTLAVVNLEGVSAGSVGAHLTIMQIDDDEGNAIPINVSSGTVSVY